MSYFTYQVAPIDWGWEQLRTVEDTARALADVDVRERLSGEAIYIADPSLDTFLARWDAAKDSARRSGWEGDFRQGPYVFWVPTEDGMQFGFVFKQDNNGTTFVVSPVELPHLL